MTFQRGYEPKEGEMADKPRTGSVRAKNIKARNVVVGVDIEGAASDEVLKAALEAMGRPTGDVTATETLEVSQDIVVGFRYLNPQAPDREDFVAELGALREMLADLAKGPGAPPEARAAAASLDDAIDEAKKKEPLGKLVVNRLRDTLEFITDASKALQAADKAGPLVLKALPAAAALYQIAQTLF
jgi:hypothetical protein